MGDLSGDDEDAVRRRRCEEEEVVRGVETARLLFGSTAVFLFLSLGGEGAVRGDELMLVGGAFRFRSVD